jgi:hypothetical protein
MRRRDELAAYRRAGVHMFYLPGAAKVAVLVELVSVNLAEICTATSSRNAKLWYLTPQGLKERDSPLAMGLRRSDHLTGHAGDRLGILEQDIDVSKPTGRAIKRLSSKYKTSRFSLACS